MTEVERMAEDFLRAHSSYFVKGRWMDIRDILTPNFNGAQKVIVAIIEIE